MDGGSVQDCRSAEIVSRLLKNARNLRDMLKYREEFMDRKLDQKSASRAARSELKEKKNKLVIFCHMLKLLGEKL